jgi:hypothetical protein
MAFSCSKAPHLKAGYVPPEETVEKYMDALRWQQFEEAKALVAPQAQKQFVAFQKQNEGILNVVEYTVGNTTVKDNGYTAVVKIKRKYFKVPAMTEQTEEFVQTWVLIGSNWYLSGPPF